MTLDDLGNLGEIISAVAVIVSLGYVAVQIRQNTKTVRASSFQELLNHVAQVNLRIVDDPEVSRLFMQARKEPFAAGSPDHLRWRSLASTIVRHWAHAFAQHRDGMLTDEQWAMLASGIPGVAGLPAFQAEWLLVKDRFPADFRAYMTSANVKSPRLEAGAPASTA